MKYARQQKEKAAAERRYLRIQHYAQEHQDMTQREIGDHFGVTDATVRKALAFIPVKVSKCVSGT